MFSSTVRLGQSSSEKRKPKLLSPKFIKKEVRSPAMQIQEEDSLQILLDQESETKSAQIINRMDAENAECSQLFESNIRPRDLMKQTHHFSGCDSIEDSFSTDQKDKASDIRFVHHETSLFQTE
jgi:hypothetical protein